MDTPRHSSLRLWLCGLSALAVLAGIAYCISWIPHRERQEPESYRRYFEQETRRFSSGKTVHFVYDQDDSKTFDVRVGDLVVLNLACDKLTGGYQWVPVDQIGPCLGPKSPKAVHHRGPNYWRGVITLEAKQAGSSMISLEQQVAQKPALPRTFAVTVNVAP